VEPQKRVEVAL